MGIPTAERYTPLGAASAKSGARGAARHGRGRKTDLLRYRVREFARRGATVDAYVSCPLCLGRSAG
jgi:hypothetical protein